MCTVHLFGQFYFFCYFVFFELLGSRKVVKKTFCCHIQSCVEKKAYQFHQNMVVKAFFNSIYFSNIRESLRNIEGVCTTNHPKFNSKLCRLLRYVLYKKIFRVTRKKLFVNCYIILREKCFLPIQRNTFLQFPECCKFISTSSLCSGYLIVKSNILQNQLKLLSGHCFTKYFSSV